MQSSRYERKFFLTNFNDRQLETMIKLHPALFSEFYYERLVNSLYFDNNSLDFYHDNVQGSQQRLKIRIRWYEDLKKATQPNLEFKIKDGLLGTKKFIALSDFSTTANLPPFSELMTGQENFQQLSKYKIKNLNPVLLVSYQRRYFQSADGKYRLTIDRDLSFYKVAANLINYQTELKLNATILELKYDRENDEQVDRISSFFPFRMSKSSKYVLGMAKIYPQLKI